MKLPAEIHELKDLSPIQVEVTSSFEEALRRFKSMVQKEKVISLYKEKQRYEKPSIKKRRKRREAAERRRVTELRDALIASGEWDKRQSLKLDRRELKSLESYNEED